MLGEQSDQKAWGWLGASITAMALGPAVMAIFVFNNIGAMALGTLIPAATAVFSCGFLVRVLSGGNTEYAS